MTENLGERLDRHAGFQRPGRKRVSETMYVDFPDVIPLQNQFEITLEIPGVDPVAVGIGEYLTAVGDVVFTKISFLLHPIFFQCLSNFGQ